MAEPSVFHILHTNDFHSRFDANAAECLRQAIAALDSDGASYLLLDAGDAVKSGNIEVNPFGEAVLSRMSDTGYHAMTMGNREFHFLQPALETKINRARFPVLCANVRAQNPETVLPVQPFAKFVVGGVRVTVLGLTVPMVTTRMTARLISHFLFEDPITTATRLLPELRPDTDILIALTHIGYRKDLLLAERVPGFDLIIGGHTHVLLSEPDTSAGTPIVQAGSHSRFYGHVRIPLGGDHKPSGAITGEILPLEALLK